MMNGSLKSIAIFAVGFVAGAATIYKFVEEKYERKYEEDVTSVRRTLSRREREAEKRKEEFEQYEREIEKNEYWNNSEEPVSNVKKKERENMGNRPYVISPEEFGEDEEYEQITLIYYSDGVLADEEDELVDDVEETVGVESLNYFGKYEEDSVFVRNDERKAEYEILRDPKSYEEVVGYNAYGSSLE